MLRVFSSYRRGERHTHDFQSLRPHTSQAEEQEENEQRAQHGGRLESARATKYCTGRATNDARDRVRRRIVNDAMKQTTREVGATANTPHHPAQTVDKPRALSPRQATRRTSRFPCPCPAVSPCRPMFLTRAGHSIPKQVFQCFKHPLTLRCEVKPKLSNSLNVWARRPAPS